MYTIKNSIDIQVFYNCIALIWKKLSNSKLSYLYSKFDEY